MPESRKRKKDQDVYTPPARSGAAKKPVKLDSPRWLPIVMVTLFVVGLLWIVTWYIAPDNPVMAPLGAWNVLVGFAMIAAGFIFATRWR